MVTSTRPADFLTVENSVAICIRAIWISSPPSLFRIRHSIAIGICHDFVRAVRCRLGGSKLLGIFVQNLIQIESCFSKTLKPTACDSNPESIWLRFPQLGVSRVFCNR